MKMGRRMLLEADILESLLGSIGEAKQLRDMSNVAVGPPASEQGKGSKKAERKQDVWHLHVSKDSPCAFMLSQRSYIAPLR